RRRRAAGEELHPALPVRVRTPYPPQAVPGGRARAAAGRGMSAVVKLQIDGRAVEVPAGTTVIAAAAKLGVYIPHFCWPPKRSIAATCRMCLVQVEKAPKPLPACATPVTEGMKVATRSEYAKQAQAGVMEFLLINHPLDCPICDQGGECQLQDLAVGYGGGAAPSIEAKRAGVAQPTGPVPAAGGRTRGGPLTPL